MFTWKRIRKFFNDIHLWLGIGAGLVLFVVCLTGTIYTFHTEIEEVLERDKFFVEVPADAQTLPIATLVEKVEAEVGEGKAGAITIPANPKRAYTVNVKKEGERRGANYLIDPYTGEYKGSTKSATSDFFMWIFRLHRWLLLDMNVGRPIVGWATVIFVFLTLTGLVIWFPQRLKSWKQGLKIKWNANWKRINHDLHNALGFYSAFILLIMSLTGLFWSFDWYRSGLYNVLGVENNRGGGRPEGGKGKAKKTAHSPEVAPLRLELLLQTADEQLSYKGNYRISLSGKGAEVSIRKNKVGFFAPASGDEVVLNKFNGEVEQLKLFKDYPFGEKVAKNIKALHVGNVFGTFSKIIYFISCLIATSLPVTGTLIWINKLKKKRARKKKVSSMEVA